MSDLPDPIKLPGREDGPTIESLARELKLRNEWIRQNHERERRLIALVGVLLDLDRCPHGRHEGDTCCSCGGVSTGNPEMRTGQVIGYGLDGVPIVMPDREHKRDPDAWRGRSDG